MTSGDYLDKILKRMTSTHNIERSFAANGRTFAAYAQYASSAEKYVLTRKANLWKVSESEHVLFMDVPADTDPESLFEESVSLIDGYMEPVFSRDHEKYPPKDHMRTFLTVVLITEHPLEKELIRKIQRFRYDKSYLFSLRGYSQGRLVAIDLPNQKSIQVPLQRTSPASTGRSSEASLCI